MPARVSAALLLCALGLPSACGPADGGEAASPADGPSAGAGADREASSGESAEEAYLRSIGYAGFSEGSAGEPDGVVLHDRARSRPGYDLVNVVPLGLTVLLDPEGQERHRWAVQDAVWSMRSILLPDGDLIVVGSDGDPRDARPHLVRLDWDGAEVWRRDEHVHHDVELTERGELLTIASEFRELPAFDAERPVEDNVLLRVSVDGEVLGRLSLHDLLVDDPGFTLETPPHQGLSGRWYDHLHANSVAWIPQALARDDDPLYGPDNVLVSLRHQNTVAVVDMARGELVWSWGRGWAVMQHEATWLPDGNVLLFDNGNENRPWSRLLVVDPRTDRVTWQWTAPEPRDFYSAGRGTVQALSEGHLLVADSNAGEAFELSADGELVWRWLSPHRDGRGRRGAIRIHRYPRPFVEAFLDAETR